MKPRFLGSAVLLGAFILIVRPTFSNTHERSAEDRIKVDIAALYGADEQQRSKATNDLVSIGEPAVAPLLEVLNDVKKPEFERAYRSAALVLGDLKARAAVPRLAWLLGTGNSGTIFMEGKTDDSLAAIDPAFEPLVKIGNPALPELKKQLSVGNWNKRYLILRILRSIDTEDSVALGTAYIGTIESELKIAKKLFPDKGSSH
jgi:hypothetical protein